MTIEVVQLTNFGAPNWYARITLADGRTWHSAPYLTQTAAEYHAAALRVSPTGYMRRW